MTSPVLDLAELRDRHPELARLVTPTQTSPDSGIQDPTSRTVGEVLFEGKTAEELVEVNRTLVGVMALHWLYNGQYEQFTECQSGSHTLTPETFGKLHYYVRGVIGEPGDPEAIARFRAMEYLIVINDLGKVQEVVDEVERRSDKVEVDHDKVLLKVLEQYPDLAASLARIGEQGFGERELRLIVDGLRTDFNVPQLMQLESVAASLRGIEGVPQDAIDFWMVHALADLAGGMGAQAQNGSLTVDEPTGQNFLLAAESVRSENRTAEGVYNRYREGLAQRLGINLEPAATRQAVTRWCGMLRTPDGAEAGQVTRAFISLPPSVKSILERELNISGLENRQALLLYYLPALVRNVRSFAITAGETPLQALQTGMAIAGKEFQQTRIALRGGTGGGGVRIIMSSALAQAATGDLQSLIDNEIRIDPAGKDSVAQLLRPVSIDISALTRGGPLADLPGERIMIVGAGGGSDCIQAALLAQLLERAGKSCTAVVSVRSSRTGSQGTSGKIGEPRSVDNHDGEIHPNTYAITSRTTGSGRFLESIPADDVPMYLAIDDGEGTSLTEQLQAIMRHAQGSDTVIVLDTGGDSLYKVVDDDQALATPDQDIRTLRSASELSDTRVLSCIVAPGIDAPRNAQAVLQAGGAQYRELSPDDTRFALDTLERRWRMDGHDPQRIGKMCLAWQAALRGKTGRQMLPLPEHLVNSEVNPWSPYVFLPQTAAGLVIMEVGDHLAALGVHGGQRTEVRAAQPPRGRVTRSRTGRNGKGGPEGGGPERGGRAPTR